MTTQYGFYIDSSRCTGCKMMPRAINGVGKARYLKSIIFSDSENEFQFNGR